MVQDGQWGGGEGQGLHPLSTFSPQLQSGL